MPSSLRTGERQLLPVFSLHLLLLTMAAADAAAVRQNNLPHHSAGLRLRCPSGSCFSHHHHHLHHHHRRHHRRRHQHHHHRCHHHNYHERQHHHYIIIIPIII